ncbi:hypothetical protein ACHAWC_008195 [Mediolabrus comicus]
MNNNNKTARRSSRRSSGASAKSNESVHPHPCPIDVSKLTDSQIRESLGRCQAQMDFANVPDAIIKELFVTDATINKHYKGNPDQILYPPAALKRTYDQIVDFYRCGKKQQLEQIENFKDYRIVFADETTTLPTTTTTDTSTATTNNEADQSSSKLCCGFTLQHIRDMRVDDERKTKLCTGFTHVVRNGFRVRADMSKKSSDAANADGSVDAWSKRFTLPVVGVITNGNDTSDIRWHIEEQEREAGVDQFEHHNIHAIECTKGTIEKQGLCAKCVANKQRLLEQLTSAVEIRENPVSSSATNLSLSRHHSTKDQKMERLTRQTDKLQRKVKAQKRVIDTLMEKTGVGFPMTKECNEIFSEDNKANVEQFLDEKEISEDSVVRYAFNESVRKQKLSRDGKKNGVRHCPLMVRLGTLVRKKMGYAGGAYDLLAKLAGLPSDRTIRRYKTPNSNEPDGFMHPNLKRARDEFNINYPAADKFDFRRHGSTAFDSMVTKGRFAANYHTNHLVGAADDAFDEDIILKELKQLEESVLNDGGSNPPALPELARNFLVFIFTTWAPENKQQILVARYGLKSITANFLKNTIRQTAIMLAKYGFIMDTVVGDGAQENRSAFKLLANIKAKDIFTDKVPADWLEELPLDFKIGFRHPSPVYSSIIIVIGGEMPHWVKKFRNAMDSNTRDLTYGGEEINLRRIYNIWLASGDGDVATGAGIRRYNKTHDHFRLDSYLKMRVFLAVQIPSQNTIQMIRDYCNPEHHDAGDEVEEEGEFENTIKIFDSVDRLVDIMNGTGYKNSKDKKVELMDKPNHRHIKELFDILRVFEDWKKDTKGFTYEYITRYTYEDLVWMIFGVAAIPVLYLKQDGSVKMHQGRSGSDVCEHFFAMIRYINQNPTMQQCREGASSISSDNIKSNLFTFKGGQNAAGAEREAADYMMPLKPSKKRKIN